MVHAQEGHCPYPPDAKKEAKNSTSKLRRRDSDFNRLLQQTYSVFVDAKRLLTQTN